MGVTKHVLSGRERPTVLRPVVAALLAGRRREPAVRQGSDEIRWTDVLGATQMARGNLLS